MKKGVLLSERKDRGKGARHMQSSKLVEKKARVWTLDIYGAAETVASLVHAGPPQDLHKQAP